jgi:hypothetical protein
MQEHCANLPAAAARRPRLPLADALYPPAFALLATATCLTQLLPAWLLLTAVGPAFLAGVHSVVIRGAVSSEIGAAKICPCYDALYVLMRYCV